MSRSKTVVEPPKQAAELQKSGDPYEDYDSLLKKFTDTQKEKEEQ